MMNTCHPRLRIFSAVVVKTIVVSANKPKAPCRLQGAASLMLQQKEIIFILNYALFSNFSIRVSGNYIQV